MKLLKTLFTSVLIAGLIISFSSCRSRKKLAKEVPPPALERVKQRSEEEQQKQTNATEQNATQPVTEVEKVNFNFKNIQFEFNSAVLKTFSYEVLDKIASEMRKSPSAKFEISGHSSAEGTEEHNRSLSEDRANAVKAYLVNSGISAGSLSTVGYGESKPVSKNTTEEGRALNRRVEIKKLN